MSMTPMMIQYLEMHDKVKDAILFFRMGDFYEMFFDDAIQVSKELELTLTGKNCGLEERAPMCGVPYHSADSYIAKLIEKGYKVAICEQVEDPATAKGLVERDIVRIITPGTFTDNNYLNPERNNFLMSLYGDKKSLGCAYLDLSTGDFIVTEYNGKDFLEFLLSQLSRYNPSEMIISSKFYENQGILEEVKKRFSLYIQPYPSKNYELVTANKKLSEHFKVFSTEALGLGGKEAAQRAAGALLSYIDETQKRQINHINQISFAEDTKAMTLDSASIRNLELTKTLRSGSKKGSLLGILDQTLTAAGSRLLTSLIESPLIDKNEINSRLDRTEELFVNEEISEQIGKILANVYDLERICSKLSYGTVVPADLLSLKQSIKAYNELILLIENSELKFIKSDFFNPDQLIDVYDLLEKSINEDHDNKKFSKTIKIKRHYNPQLDNYLMASENGSKWLEKLEQKEREATGINILKVKYNKVFGYFIEVPNGKKDLVPDRYIRKQTLTNSERFFTPELKKLEEKITEAEEKLSTLENELYQEILSFVKDRINRIQKVAKLCSKLDVFRSFAEVARQNNYVRPSFLDNGEIVIRKGRHPVVEQFTGQNYFISNDTNLLDNEKLMLITGPNMAGKSTYIRQNALIVLMAQIGSYVPAEKAEISIVDRIFTRVGASDDLSTGQSTFMVEMTEVSNILKNATSNSLIILDEIGRGTSTYDGISIAWALCEELLKRDVKTLFATHYHELTDLEKDNNSLVNYCIDVHEEKNEVIFLRKIKKGRANQSYGIEVAKLAGFPQRVLNRANKILETLENHAPKQKLPNFNDPNQLSFFSPSSQNLKENNVVLNFIEDLEPDELSPREALDTLYQLKDLFNENKNS